MLNKIIKKSFSKKLKTFGFITIPEGEKFLIWERNGKLTIKSGPTRLFNLFKNIEPMKLHIASPSEYIQIKKINGEELYLQGPTSCYFNPLEHTLILVQNSTTINNKEALVVYKEENSKIERNIIYGPQQYYPRGKEWYHKFNWHGHDNRSPNVYRKIAGVLRFTTLRLIPDQFYYDIENVRTKDDALVTINTMIYFQLTDIEKMLDNTHDPIAQFINDLSADIIEFISNKTFEEFKKNTEHLNQIETYKQLVHNSTSIGYSISKVIFRGYVVNQKLQEMHNDAIEKRTMLVLTRETEEENQKLEDLRLIKMLEREEAKQQLEVDKAIHEENIKKITHEENMRQTREIYELNYANTSKLNEIELNRLIALQQFGNDFLKIMIAEKQNVEKIIKIEGDSETKKHIHL